MKKIVIIGPESTGKSTIAAELAFNYNTAFVPEAARLYMENMKYKFSVNDIVEIAKLQIAAEDAAAARAKDILFCDTDLIVCKVWSENAFGFCPQFIIDQIEQRVYHFYLLMNIDIPWQPDPLREHPHLRQHFFDIYQKELLQYFKNFQIISGTGSARTTSAITAIDQYLKNT